MPLYAKRSMLDALRRMTEQGDLTEREYRIYEQDRASLDRVLNGQTRP